MIKTSPDLASLLRKELKRKIFHFFSFIYTLGYLVLGRTTILIILGGLLIAEGALEFGRFLIPRLNAALLRAFGGIHRAEEERRISGIFWTLLGTFLAILLIKDRSALLCSMGFLIFGDTAAAFAGLRWGTRKFHGKSLEGMAGFFLTALPIGLCFYDLPTALFAAAFAAIVEFVPLPFNDNLWIPILSGFFLQSLRPLA